MNEPNGMLLALGFFMIFGGLIWAYIGSFQTKIRIVIIGFLVMTLGAVIFLHIFWGAWWLFLQNVVWAVPTLVWVVAGITAYFTFNHVYASWRMYVYAHPESFAKKILNPWPTILMPPTRTPERVGHYMFGTILFILTWLIAFLCYTAWLIFGGGIAKLLHLMPRE